MNESEPNMSLRARLFLFFGAFIALLVAAQWWWMQSLTRELREESERLAMFVGASVAQILTVDLACEEGQTCDPMVEVTHTWDGEHPHDHGGSQVSPWKPEPAASQDGAKSNTVWQWQGGFKLDRSASEDTKKLLAEAPKRVQEILNSMDSGSGSGPVIRIVPSPLPSGGENQQRNLHDLVVVVTDDTSNETFLEPFSNGEWRQEVESHSEDGKTIIRRRIVTPQGSQESTEVMDPDQPVNTFFHVDHDHDADNRFLVLERPDRVAQVPIPQSGADALERFQTRLWLGSAALTVLGLLVAAWLAHRVSSPLRDMAEAATEVGNGALGTQVEAHSRDREIQSTLKAFNHMSARLQELDSETRRLEALRHLGELGDVARGIAHTLRNPLNALGLSVEELAARGDETDTDDGLVESARRQIRRLDRGIRSFLLLASQSGGVIDDVDLVELVRDVALEALQDNPGGPRLVVDIPEELNARLPAVEPELRAVVQALVVNALEAGPPDGQVTVSVAEGAEGRFLVRIDDQGPGLPSEIRQRLFTPHLSTKANGSGMGLFLAHRIAGHRYDGRLDLLDRRPSGVRAELEIGRRRAIAEPEAPSQVGLEPAA